jgi:hypothetical protein
LIALGGPASLIGLDLAGSYNCPERRSTSQGIANMGAFLAAITVMLVVGWILDLRTGAQPSQLLDYRVALSTIFVPIALSTLGLLFFWWRTRRRALSLAAN